MTDPLGQSQVIPYLQGLSKNGHQFWLISFEKKERFISGGAQIKALLERAGIVWVPCTYTEKPPVISTIYDIFIMRKRAFAFIKKEKIQVVHCRSYISALCGLWAKKRFGTKFIFDMRGFWADERVDGGIWHLSNWLYRLIYNYFKQKERAFLLNADAIVSLTDNARTEILSWQGCTQLSIDVIPCCADLDLFSPEKVLPEQKQTLSQQVGIAPGSFVVSYLGSVGTWYMLPEMLQFFGLLLEKKPHAIFLIISPDKPEQILNEVKKQLPDIAPGKIVIEKAERKDVPAWASLSDLSLFFIRPLYSKKASSPTKMAELMGLGIPLVCNAGVGDVESVLRSGGNGLIINSLSKEEMSRSIAQIDELLKANRNNNIHCARAMFSLEEGVRRYEKIYARLHS